MKSNIKITDAEWEVMAVAWRRPPVPAGDIADELRASKHWTLATVRTLLRRLVNKKALAQRTEGRRFLYTPLVSMEACIREESDSFWDRALGRAPSPAILHLVRRADLSTEDIEELRRILREKEK
jgi:BlaI family penicillinase repressor